MYGNITENVKNRWLQDTELCDKIHFREYEKNDFSYKPERGV